MENREPVTPYFVTIPFNPSAEMPPPVYGSSTLVDRPEPAPRWGTLLLACGLALGTACLTLIGLGVLGFVEMIIDLLVR